MPAVAGILLLACGAALVVSPFTDALWAAGSAASARGEQESERLTAAADDAPAGTRDVGWDDQSPPSGDVVAYGDSIGVLTIPALGSDYRRVLAEGVGLDVLDRPEIGHFPGTAGPGGIGNFALAGHRSTALLGLAKVVPGDRVYIQTADGYFTYEVTRAHDIVAPTAMEVVAPVPGSIGTPATERVLTLITCYPEWGNAERLVLHADFVEWRPARAGPPAAIA
jgi:sortase A